MSNFKNTWWRRLRKAVYDRTWHTRNQIGEWVQRLNWTQLRSLGNSRLIRTSFIWFVAVPILASILHHNQTWLPFDVPYRLKAFYFMSFSFALAQAVYLLACPKLVRRYRTFAEYRLDHVGSYDLASQLTQLTYADRDWRIQISHFHVNILTNLKMFRDEDDPEQMGTWFSQLISSIDALPEKLQSDLFDTLVERLSFLHRRCICASWFFFVIGFGIFAVFICLRGLLEVLRLT